MPTRLAHPHLRVQDLGATLDFFCVKLGFKEINRIEVREPRMTLVYLAAPGDLRHGDEVSSVSLELAWLPDGEPITDGSRFAHVAFFVDDLEETCARLGARGVPIPVPPQPSGYAYALSPDGMTIELLQASAPKSGTIRRSR